MTYSAVYCALITKRLQNPIDRNDCYCEKHHIIPKSEGGKDEPDNLVNLTAREHYIAHLLLAKIYNDRNMWNALLMMGCGKNNGNARDIHKVNSRLFEQMKVIAVKKNADARRGRKLSPEHILKCTAHLKKYFYKKGDNKRRGTKHKPETIEKIRAWATGRHWTESQRKKIYEYWKRKRALRPVKQKKPLHNKKPVSQYTLTGELIQTFPSASQAARVLGVSQAVITMCCRGVRKTCLDYVFKYAGE